MRERTENESKWKINSIFAEVFLVPHTAHQSRWILYSLNECRARNSEKGKKSRTTNKCRFAHAQSEYVCVCAVCSTIFIYGRTWRRNEPIRLISILENKNRLFFSLSLSPSLLLSFSLSLLFLPSLFCIQFCIRFTGHTFRGIRKNASCLVLGF